MTTALTVFALILVSTLIVAIVLHTMKTAELAAAVSNLSTAVNNLSSTIDRAVEVLGNTEVTPDSDVVAAIGVIDTQTASLNTANDKLKAALPPAPTP